MMNSMDYVLVLLVIFTSMMLLTLFGTYLGRVINSYIMMNKEAAILNEHYLVWVHLIHSNTTWEQPRVGFESEKVWLFENLPISRQNKMKFWVKSSFESKLNKRFPIQDSSGRLHN